MSYHYIQKASNFLDNRQEPFFPNGTNTISFHFRSINSIVHFWSLIMITFNPKEHWILHIIRTVFLVIISNLAASPNWYFLDSIIIIISMNLIAPFFLIPCRILQGIVFPDWLILRCVLESVAIYLYWWRFIFIKTSILRLSDAVQSFLLDIICFFMFRAEEHDVTDAKGTCVIAVISWLHVWHTSWVIRCIRVIFFIAFISVNEITKISLKVSWLFLKSTSNNGSFR